MFCQGDFIKLAIANGAEKCQLLQRGIAAGRDIKDAERGRTATETGDGDTAVGTHVR